VARAAARATRFAAEEHGDGNPVTSTREIVAGAAAAAYATNVEVTSRHTIPEGEAVSNGQLQQEQRQREHEEEQQERQHHRHKEDQSAKASSAAAAAAAILARAATSRALAAAGNIRALLRAEEVLAIAAVRHVSLQKSRVRRAKRQILKPKRLDPI
jgi:G3E family GTPase